MRSLNKVLGVLAIIAIGAFFYIKFKDSLDPFSQGQSQYETLFVALVLLLTVGYNLAVSKVIVKSRLSFSIIWYFIWLWLSSIMATVHHPFGSLNLIGLLLVPLFSYLVMYKVAYSFDEKEKLIILICISCFVVLLSVQYLMNRASLLSFITQDTQASGGAYFALVLLPFILLIPNNIIKYLLSCLLLAVSVFSAKRGGTIAVGMAIVVNMIVDFVFPSRTSDNKKRLKTILFIVLLVVLVVYYIVPLFLSDATAGLLERFEDDDYSENSRSMIYRKVIQMIMSSDIVYMVFGHGWDAVLADNTTMGYSAHNDFLESFYDFGFIGFLLYLNMHLQLFRESIRLIKSRSKYAGPFAASWVMFLVLASISHVILYPPMSIVFTMFWGYTKGSMESIKYNNFKNRVQIVS